MKKLESVCPHIAAVRLALNWLTAVGSSDKSLYEEKKDSTADEKLTLKRQNIIAHRGLWFEASEKNTLGALTEALKQGFGIETDFRDLDGDLVVSHDPPRRSGALAARDLFEFYARSGSAGRLALNIKADGLQAFIASALSELSQDNAYAFDMSVPDALGYVRRSFPVYTRYSQFERSPSLIDKAEGVWVDDFDGSAPQVEVAGEFLALGLRVALVSPELHGRDHIPIWGAVEAAGLHRHPKFELCTDFPLEAAKRLGTDK